MAHFEIPETVKFDYMDLNDLRGLDSYSKSPNYMRASDMINMIKKDGLHRVRPSVKQINYVAKSLLPGTPNTGSDYDYKYIGKVEEIEDGNTVPYYIMIREKLGQKDAKNESKMMITCGPSPRFGFGLEPGLESYFPTRKEFSFTNKGETGNRTGLYETINYDDKEWIFTPIGIITFNCSTKIIELVNPEPGGEPIRRKELNFEVINVLDNPYVPKIVISSKPDGTGFSKYESINLLSDKRQVSFLSDGVATVYKLPEKNLDVDSATVKVLNDKGNYDDKTDFTFDEVDGTLTFTTPPIAPYVPGQDNVIVEYSKELIKSEKTTLKLRNETAHKKLKTTLTLSLNSDKTVHGVIFYELGSNYDKSKDTLKDLDVRVLTNGYDLSQHYDPGIIDMLINDGSLTSDFDTPLPVDINGEWRIRTVIKYETESTETISYDGSTEDPTLIEESPETFVNNAPTDKVNVEYFGSIESQVGNEVDGSDSYWLVNFLPSLVLKDTKDIILPNKKIFAYIYDSEYEVGETGNMDGSHLSYPYNASAFVCKIPYSDILNDSDIHISGNIKIEDNVDYLGGYVNKISGQVITYHLPKITLPSAEYIPGQKPLISENGLGVHYISKDDKKTEDMINARLMCYYNCKSAIVYGYEADRRIFVTDGSAVDTYSGNTLNGQSSIYYFPDDNYRRLGEDTEILGYAQADNLLYTVKRGEDSLYVRYGTTINKVVEFPASIVLKNLQILTRPIQVGNEVLVITRDGIISITYTNNECRTHLRSYFINNYFELNADYDYDKMQYYVEDNLLTIFLDNKSFTTDLTLKSFVREGNTPGRNSGTSTLDYQYDWFVSEYPKKNVKNNPPLMKVYQPRDFERYDYGISYNGLSVIGYSTKGIYEFKWDGNKVDEIVVPKNNGTFLLFSIPIPAHYITPFMDFGVINVAKTIRYLYINTRARNGFAYEVGYIDEEGEEITLDRIYGDINDTLTKYRNELVPFPKLIQIKSKIKKFMNIKLYIRNLAEKDIVEKNPIPRLPDEYKDMNFDRIVIQYHIAGKYRGE